MGRRKKTTEEEVCKGLKRLAFGEIKDAIYLLFADENEMAEWKLNFLTELRHLKN